MASEHEILSKSCKIKAGAQLGLAPNIICLSITVPTPLSDLSWFGLIFWGSFVANEGFFFDGDVQKLFPGQSTEGREHNMK